MKKTLVNYLGLLGIISLMSYAAAVVFAPLADPNYNWMKQAVSDLSVMGAPSELLWRQLSCLYAPCGIVSIMAVCVYISGRLNKTTRLGIYLFAAMNWLSAVGYTMFPLSASGYANAFQDIMHVYVVTAGVVLLSISSLLLIIIGGFRKRQYPSLAIWAVIALALMFIGVMAVNIVSKEYFGFFERFSVFAATGFNAVLGIYLFRGFEKSGQTLTERAKQLKTDIPAVFIALKKKETPLIAKIIAAITVAYALSTIDFIPDFIPVIGLLDDVILLPGLIALMIKLIPAEIFAECRKEAAGLWKNGKPKKWYYAIPIVAIWLLLIFIIIKAIWL